MAVLESITSEIFSQISGIQLHNYKTESSRVMNCIDNASGIDPAQRNYLRKELMEKVTSYADTAQQQKNFEMYSERKRLMRSLSN